jgi:hypothetical protein
MFFSGKPRSCCSIFGGQRVVGARQSTHQERDADEPGDIG